MTPDTLTQILARAGTTLATTPNGRLLTTHIPPNLADTVHHHHAELANHITAHRRPGNWRWRPCDTCRRPQLVAGAAVGRRCALTPGCPGHLHNPPTPPPLTDPATGTDIGCSRPGCQEPATMTTYTHEALCAVDAAHLALGAR